MSARQLPAVLHVTSSATNQVDTFLVHVESSGSRPLDVKLIGTDGDMVFAVSLQHNKISSLKSKNSPCSEEEWIHILTSILLPELPKEGQEDVTRGIEIHTKAENKAMTLVIQKVIEGIKQRLGVIKLDETDEEEIGLFEWCAVATKSANSFRDELEALQIKYKEQQEMLNRLDRKFKKLSELKTENEDQLSENLVLLLNEKKLKIRNQQRLLAGAKVDADKVNAVQASRSGKLRVTGASRSGKRKAAKEAQAESSDSDDAFEKMDIDENRDEDDTADESDRPEMQTPEPSDDETASEDEADVAPTTSRLAVRKNALQEESDEEMQPAPTPTEPSQLAELPRRRELPFTKKAAPVSAPKLANDGSETESGSDDEL